MALRSSIAITLGFALFTLGGTAWAQEHARSEAPRAEEHARPAPPPRQAPPKFVAHPPGAHPRGATVPRHDVRVLSPVTVTRRGHRTWSHWDHPEFNRPSYYWNWSTIHSVSCVAEDSYGDQYPVSESTWSGFGLDSMTTVEDDALDRCYSESGSDGNCVLATCSHF